MGQLIRFRRRRKGSEDAKARPLFPTFVLSVESSRRRTNDARPAPFPSDAIPTDDPPRPGNAPDPGVERRRKRRRNGAIALFAAIFVFGVLAAIFGDRGYLDVRRQRERLRAMQAAVDADEARVQALKRKIDHLRSDPTAIERIAREELDYAAPGEIVLLLPKDPSARGPNLDAKDGSDIVPPASTTP